LVHSLTLTDIHSGWTECAALVIREQTLAVEGISLIRHQLPFALRGLDTDNDSAFMNETLQSYWSYPVSMDGVGLAVNSVC
jgi:hypothetical protein